MFSNAADASRQNSSPPVTSITIPNAKKQVTLTAFTTALARAKRTGRLELLVAVEP